MRPTERTRARRPGAAPPGGSAMTTERRPRPRTPPGIAATADLKRIPLPALPHFRRAGTAPGDAPATPSGPGAVGPAVPTAGLKRPPAAAARSTAEAGP